MSSTLSKTEIIIYVTSILSSANALNLDKVKLLSSGNGFRYRVNDPRSVCINHSYKDFFFVSLILEFSEFESDTTYDLLNHLGLPNCVTSNSENLFSQLVLLSNVENLQEWRVNTVGWLYWSLTPL